MMRNMKTSHLALTTAILAAGVTPTLAQNPAQQAGVAAAVRGQVILAATVPAATDRVVGQNLDSGDRIFLGDLIETGPNSGMQIMLLDETIFTIGPDAGLVIDAFVYDPTNNAGQVTASVVKGAFRFVSGRVAKEEPRNMSVQTPVGTIGIRGTSAAGFVSPPDANGNQTADIVLLGPGVDNNANERAGRIIVSGGGASVEITRSGFGTTISGQNAIPTPPVRFEPSQVAALTGGLGTDGGARPAAAPAQGTATSGDQSQSGQDGQQGQQGQQSQQGQQGQQGQAGQQNQQGPGNSGNGPAPAASPGPNPAGGQQVNAPAGGPAGGAPIALGQANALTGQNLGSGVINASLLGQVGGAQGEANQAILRATEQTNTAINTAVATFDQLRSIESGTATFDFGTVNLAHVSGPHTNSGGSFQANAMIDFGARSLDLTISSVSYFFNGGTNQLFVFNPDGTSNDLDGTYDNDFGDVSGNWNTTDNADHFATMPTDGSSVEINAAILNNTATGVIASDGRVRMRIDNGTDIIEGSKVVGAQ